MTRRISVEKYIDKKYGRLRVLSFSHRDEKNIGHYFYDCKCDCGNVKKYRICALQSGATVSCGCYFKEINVVHLKGNTFARKDLGEGAFNNLLSSYINTAKKRGYQFSLTKEQVKILTKGNCFYCGEEPRNVKRIKDGYGDYIYNGIDRLDNAIGYETSNCVSCCIKCNSMKNSISKEMVYKLYHALFNPKTKGKNLCLYS